jgi:sporulation protein YlmC with PRC-barrel domain
MKLQSDVRAKACTTTITLPEVLDRPGRHHLLHIGGPLTCIVIGIVLSLLIAVETYPALSQAVQLVKVDVQVVANGYRVSKLTGHTVVNDKDERIGKIDDFVIGHDVGHSLFTVLQVGGFLGIGSRLVAVPYDSLTIDQTASKIELPGATKDQLKQLAEFQYGS